MRRCVRVCTKVSYVKVSDADPTSPTERAWPLSGHAKRSPRDLIVQSLFMQVLRNIFKSPTPRIPTVPTYRISVQLPARKQTDRGTGPPCRSQASERIARRTHPDIARTPTLPPTPPFPSPHAVCPPHQTLSPPNSLPIKLSPHQTLAPPSPQPEIGPRPKI